MNSLANIFILISFIVVGVILYSATKEHKDILDFECGMREERLSAMDSGTSGYRLIGGSEVEASIWPWQVSIMHRSDPSSPFLLHCGGTIIHKSWILTAAACVYNSEHQLLSNLIVKAGANNIYNDDENTQLLEIEKIVTHHMYNPITLRNNIALLKLQTPLVFNQLVDQICIPSKVDVEEHLFGACYITGYGETPDDEGILQEARVDIFLNSRCNKPTWHNYRVAADMFCAGGVQGGPDGCEKNLGGPINCYIASLKQYYIFGIRVDTQQCGVSRKPNIYLKVSRHFYWIETELAKTESTS